MFYTLLALFNKVINLRRPHKQSKTNTKRQRQKNVEKYATKIKQAHAEHVHVSINVCVCVWSLCVYVTGPTSSIIKNVNLAKKVCKIPERGTENMLRCHRHCLSKDTRAMCTALRASRKCCACCCQYHQPSFMVSLAIGPESEQAEQLKL